MRTRSFLFGSLALLGAAYAFGAVGCSSTITQIVDDAGTGKSDSGGTVGDDTTDGGGTGDDSGTTGKDSGGGTDSGGGKDSGPLPQIDAGADASHPLADGGVCPGTAPTTGDLDNAGGWHGPKTRNTGACTAGDITKLQSNFGTAQSYADLKTGLSASCQACAFSLESDTQWGPIVTDAQQQAGFINFGACYASLSGSANCGKFIQYDEFCVTISCNQCATDQDFTACQQSQQTAAQCGANFGAGITSNCTGDATTLDNTCGNIIPATKYLCGPP